MNRKLEKKRGGGGTNGQRHGVGPRLRRGPRTSLQGQPRLSFPRPFFRVVASSVCPPVGPITGRKLELNPAHNLATTRSRLGAKLGLASAAAWRRCRQRPRERRKKQAVSPSLDSEPLPPTPRERDGALSWPDIAAADNLTVAESCGLVRCRFVYFVNLRCKSLSTQQTKAEMY